METKIYVAAQSSVSFPLEACYVPLFCGVLPGEADILSDAAGDNISEKNVNYCELTGVYWIWKNSSADIVGLCHYRRYFLREEYFLKNRERMKDIFISVLPGELKRNMLSEADIQRLLSENDIIIGSALENLYRTNGQQYIQYHKEKDLLTVREVIQERSPLYLRAFDLFMDCYVIHPCNMFITKKEIFDEYCAWLFDILFEVERRTDLTDYGEYQRRVFGFLSERLFNVWLMMQKYRVVEQSIGLVQEA